MQTKDKQDNRAVTQNDKTQSLDKALKAIEALDRVGVPDAFYNLEPPYKRFVEVGEF